ncbi:hypothetical protein DU475_22495 [Rhodopseudomonas sp. WA056]|nr:hypothetical protein [Rhodopseudomonas sp. WA056]
MRSSIFVTARSGATKQSSCFGTTHQPVMPGLVPGIHSCCIDRDEGVDGRDKPGHDDVRVRWHRS